MHRLYRVAQMLRAQPVAILPRVFAVVDEQLSSAIVNGAKARLDADSTDDKPAFKIVDGVAIVPMYGICGRRLSDIDMACGGVDVERVARLLQDADADSTVQAIVLDVASPGGSVAGVAACADAVRKLTKPTVVFCDEMCASAAYWICSQATAIVCSQTAELGSIGVYCAYLDESVAYDRSGRRVDVITSGAYKGAGVPGTSLSEDQRADMQRNIDTLAEIFKATVLEARPLISPEILDGRVFVGSEAVTQGLADQVGSMADAIELAKSL